MNKHSPAPWTISYDCGDRSLVAADGTSLMGEYQFYPWAPSSQADWLLIASAPDLLHCLKVIVEHVGDDKKLASLLHLSHAKAAINKATGEQL